MFTLLNNNNNKYFLQAQKSGYASCQWTLVTHCSTMFLKSLRLPWVVKSFLPFLFRTKYNMSSLADELWIQEIQEKNENLNEGLLEWGWQEDRTESLTQEVQGSLVPTNNPVSLSSLEAGCRKQSLNIYVLSRCHRHKQYMSWFLK